MTDTDANALNHDVALAMGWARRLPEADGADEECRWLTPTGQAVFCEEGFEGLPDFCRDVMAMGYLMEWAGGRKNFCVILDNAKKYHPSIWKADIGGTDNNDKDFYGHGDTAGEAFCKAILEYVQHVKREATQ